MTPQLLAAWAAALGTPADPDPVTADERPEDAEETELARIDRRFHTCLDREYGRDESRWPAAARYAYLSTRDAIHGHFHPKEAA